MSTKSKSRFAIEELTSQQKRHSIQKIREIWGHDFEIYIRSGWPDSPGRDFLAIVARLCEYISVDKFAHGVAHIQVRRLIDSESASRVHSNYKLRDIKLFEQSVRGHKDSESTVAIQYASPMPEEECGKPPEVSYHWNQLIGKSWGVDFSRSIPLSRRPEVEIFETLSILAKDTALDVFVGRIREIIANRRRIVCQGRRVNSPVMLLEDVRLYLATCKPGSKGTKKRLYDSESEDEFVTKIPRTQTTSSPLTPFTMQTRSERPRELDRNINANESSDLDPGDRSTQRHSLAGKIACFSETHSTGFTLHEHHDPDLGLSQESPGRSLESLATSPIRSSVERARFRTREIGLTFQDPDALWIDQISRPVKLGQHIVDDVDVGFVKLTHDRAQSALDSLNKGEMVNDEAITVCLQREILVSHNPRHIVLDTIFVSKLLSRQSLGQIISIATAEERLQKKYTGKNRPFPIFLAPIHHKSGNHWSFATIDMNLGILRYYDSIKDNERFLETSHKIMDWMRIMVPSRNNIEYTSEAQDCPQQKDGISCGIFVILFGCHVINDVQLPSYFDVEKFRARLVENVTALEIFLRPSDSGSSSRAAISPATQRELLRRSISPSSSLSSVKSIELEDEVTVVEEDESSADEEINLVANEEEEESIKDEDEVNIFDAPNVLARDKVPVETVDDVSISANQSDEEMMEEGDISPVYETPHTQIDGQDESLLPQDVDELGNSNVQQLARPSVREVTSTELLAEFIEKQRKCRVSLARAVSDVATTSIQVETWISVWSDVQNKLFARLGKMNENYGSPSLEDSETFTRLHEESAKAFTAALKKRKVSEALKMKAQSFQKRYETKLAQLDALILALQEMEDGFDEDTGDDEFQLEILRAGELSWDE